MEIKERSAAGIKVWAALLFKSEGIADPYENNAYFIAFLFLFYMLFYSYHFCIFSLFSWPILKQFFT